MYIRAEKRDKKRKNKRKMKVSGSRVKQLLKIILSKANERPNNPTSDK